MIWLADYANKGFSQAILVAVVTLLMSLLFPPLFWVNGALIAFLFLANTKADFVKIVVITTLVSFVILQFGSGAGSVVFGLVVLWLPILVSAWFIKQFNAFSIGVEIAVVSAFLLVLLLMLFSADTQNFWLEVINEVFPDEVSSMEGQQNIKELLINHINSLTGWLAAGVLLGTFVSLVLARMWQRVLLFKQGFADEFVQIRFSRTLSIIGLVLYVISLFYSNVLIENLIPVVMIGFFFVGLAITHGFIAEKGKKLALLIIFYLFLVLMFPLVSFFLALLGLSDHWLQYRKKFL